MTDNKIIVQSTLLVGVLKLIHLTAVVNLNWPKKIDDGKTFSHGISSARLRIKTSALVESSDHFKVR